MKIKNNLHKKGFALALVLKQRLPASRKRPIVFTNLRVTMKTITGDQF